MKRKLSELDYEQLDYKSMRRHIEDCHPAPSSNTPTEINAFNSDTQELEQRRQQLKDKELDLCARAETLGKKLAYSAKTSRLKLATAFHAAMPRELRDHVYRDLIRSLPASPKTWNYPPAHQNTMEHWFHPEFVGPDFGRECAVTYYEEFKFSFVDDLDIRRLHRPLEEDMFGYGVVPADHIRSCELQFHVRNAGIVLNTISGLRTPDYTEHFEALSTLKPASATVSIYINMIGYGEAFRLKALVLYLDLLKSHLYRYRDKGYKFEVYVAAYNSNVPMGHGRSITYLWDMTPEDLDKKVQEWRAACSACRSINFPSTTLRGRVTLSDEADYEMLSRILMGK